MHSFVHTFLDGCRLQGDQCHTGGQTGVRGRRRAHHTGGAEGGGDEAVVLLRWRSLRDGNRRPQGNRTWKARRARHTRRCVRGPCPWPGLQVTWYRVYGAVPRPLCRWACVSLACAPSFSAQPHHRTTTTVPLACTGSAQHALLLPPPPPPRAHVATLLRHHHRRAVTTPRASRPSAGPTPAGRPCPTAACPTPSTSPLSA